MDQPELQSGDAICLSTLSAVFLEGVISRFVGATPIPAKPECAVTLYLAVMHSSGARKDQIACSPHAPCTSVSDQSFLYEPWRVFLM